MSKHVTEVAIGLPVYNGGDSLGNAIETLVSQTYRDFVLIISDNCSTDQTESICREYAKNDSRIVYIRQPENIGAERNFAFVLDQADSEYFLWAASDDYRSPDFIDVNLRFLKENPDFVSSISPSRFENGNFDEIEMGDKSLSGDVEDRFIQFFGYWHANSRFYGLSRREVILKAFKNRQAFLGSDWAIMLECCLSGKLNRCEQGWMVRGANGASNQKNIFKIYHKHWHEIFFPLSKLTAAVFQMTSGFSPRSRATLAWRLIQLNLDAVRVRRQLSRSSKQLGLNP